MSATPAMMRVTTILLVLMAAVLHHAHAQEPTLTPEDIQSMLDNTGIAPGGFCNAALNNYQVVLVSGLSWDAQSALVLDCTGCENTTVAQTLDAFSASTPITITAPVSCVVANRFCRLLMYVYNPYVPVGDTPGLVLVSNFESTCGVVPPNDYTAGCDWVDFACQMTNGEWYHYGPALCMYLGFVFVTMALGTAVWLVVEHNSHQFRLANVAKSLTGNAGLAAMTFMEGVNSQFQTNTLNPLPARPAGFYNNAPSSSSTSVGGVKGGSGFAQNPAAASMKHRGKGGARAGEVSITGLLQTMNGGGGSGF